MAETIDLITLKDPRSPAAEAFRTLRTNIQFSSVDKPIHTLVVTSSAPDDGKSGTLANLAVTMAQSGHTTILVDTDLRKPSQHTIWKLKNDEGLTTLIQGGADNSGLPLQHVGVENLSVLTSGPLPPVPADLIGSKRMDEVIGLLRAQADYVLFDAPPVLAVTDAALLAQKLDGLLLVVKAGMTRRDHAQKAKDVLARLNIRVLGVALTNAPREPGINTYYGR